MVPHGAIRYRTHKTDYSNLPHKEYNWARTVYAGAREEKPCDLPKPLGKYVKSTHYVDANVHHDLVTGKAFTAILPFVNPLLSIPTPREKQVWKQHHLDQNLLLQELQLMRSLILEPHYVSWCPSQPQELHVWRQHGCC